MSKLLPLLWFLSLFPGCSSDFIPCLRDEGRRKARSEELQKIVKQDQADRENWGKLTADQLKAVAKADEARRKRVGEIFGEGCFSDAKDYAAAALVYQHGDTPDHFYQTFLWSQRAVELGDAKRKELAALGIDRYLVNLGRKQLFATQAHQEKLGDCFCLQPVEKSFPDRRRKEAVARSYRDALKWLNELNAGKKCPARECTKPLSPSPRGTVPGFW